MKKETTCAKCGKPIKGPYETDILPDGKKIYRHKKCALVVR